MNGIKIDLSDFARIVYPGAITWTFLYWRYGDSLCITQFNAIFIPLSLIAGVLLYAMYRCLHYSIRCFEKKMGFVPQFKFHDSVVDEVARTLEITEELKEKLKSVKWAASCANKILQTAPPHEFAKSLYFFNSFVHVLFLSSFLSLAALLHDLIAPPFSERLDLSWWLLLWLAASSLFFAGGLFADCKQSDPAEAAFLCQHRDEYEKLVRELIAAKME